MHASPRPPQCLSGCDSRLSHSVRPRTAVGVLRTGTANSSHHFSSLMLSSFRFRELMGSANPAEGGWERRHGADIAVSASVGRWGTLIRSQHIPVPLSERLLRRFVFRWFLPHSRSFQLSAERICDPGSFPQPELQHSPVAGGLCSFFVLLSGSPFLPLCSNSF